MTAITDGDGEVIIVLMVPVALHFDVECNVGVLHSDHVLVDGERWLDMISLDADGDGAAATGSQGIPGQIPEGHDALVIVLGTARRKRK